MSMPINEPLPAWSRPTPRVRYNAEYFGFIVGFPNGEIVLAEPAAMAVLHQQVAREEVEPYLLNNLHVRREFYLATPVLVWMELTRRCNLHCPHCYIDAGDARSGELPTERWFELLDEMADMGVWAVAFTGGEPTLHPAFGELVRHARSRDLLVGIASHGMFLSDRLLDSLPRDGVIISVSIDNLHLGRKGVPVPIGQGLAAIKRAQAHGFLSNIMTNTNHQNIRELQWIMEWAESNGVSVRSVPFSPIGRGRQHLYLQNTVDDVELAARFWMKECEWEHDYHREAGLCVGSIFNYGLTLAHMTRRCSSGRYLCYIAADGTIFPCTMCAAESLFAAGSAASRPFPEIWRQPWQIRKHSWADFETTCQGCPINDAQYYCSSRCPVMSFARHGTFSDCGASEFEIHSTMRRTELLEASPLYRQVEESSKDASNGETFRGAP